MVAVVFYVSDFRGMAARCRSSGQENPSVTDTTPRNASVNVARFRQSNKQRDFCIESALDKDDVRSR